MGTDGNQIERERRFLVRGFDQEILRKKYDVIVQGYFEITEDHEFRVRLINGIVVEVTSKSGSGMDRSEPKPKTEDVPSQGFARFVLDQMIYKIAKLRRKIDGWEFDEFQGPLAGLHLVEYEGADADKELERPPWIHDWVEVTDTLSNRMLARLAYEREHGDDLASDVMRHVLPPSMPRWVLTGAPCSGKTTIMNELKRLYANHVHFVPEMATLVMEQLDITPPDSNSKSEMNRFQLELARAQQSFETLAIMHAAQTQKKLVIFDRGIPDNAAYLSRGDISPLAGLLRTSPERLYQRYDRVLILAVPDEDTYNAHRANNPHRRESYKEARKLGEYIESAWDKHEKHRLINDDKWKDKVEAVVRRVEKLLITA